LIVIEEIRRNSECQKAVNTC